jgi:hypothetical protein
MLCRARKRGKVKGESGLNEVCLRALVSGGEGLTDKAPPGDFPSVMRLQRAAARR